MAKHAYKVGDSVMVWNQSLSGRKLCEGRAEVRELCLSDDDTYLVKFPGEYGLYRRLVELDAADLPENDPRVTFNSGPPVSMGSAASREIPPA